MLTHYNMVSLQAQVFALWPFLEPGKEMVIAFLPFFHIYGQVVLMLCGLSQGHTLVLFTTPDLDDILAELSGTGPPGFTVCLRFTSISKSSIRPNGSTGNGLRRSFAVQIPCIIHH